MGFVIFVGKILVYMSLIIFVGKILGVHGFCWQEQEVVVTWRSFVFNGDSK